jgi:hypothetical protein
MGGKSALIFYMIERSRILRPSRRGVIKRGGGSAVAGDGRAGATAAGNGVRRHQDVRPG